MNSSRLIGIVILVVGIVLLIVGVNASHSMADSVTNAFTGHFTQATTWYILGGIVVAILGLILLLMGPGGKKA